MKNEKLVGVVVLVCMVFGFSFYWDRFSKSDVYTVKAVEMAAKVKSGDEALKGLSGLDGVSVKLGRSDWKAGKRERLLVYLWATWCGVCEEKLVKVLPEMQERDGIRIVTVSVDKDVNRVKHFVDTKKIKMDVARDDSRDLVIDLKAFSVPHWAVYDRTGENSWLLIKTAGGWDGDEVEKALK